MSNPFGTSAMAEGYATSRPPLHPLIVEKIRNRLGCPAGFARALDVGCGAGLSTAALKGIARYSVGIEPAEGMLRRAAITAPQADFAAARAEALPIRSGSIGLIAAAGSLNYIDPVLFFREAARVLAPGGVVAVYDFSTGRSFAGSAALDEWFSGFTARYPWPPGEAIPLDPERIAALDHGFRMLAAENFEIGLTLTPAFYLEYMMTETNVAFALRRGAPEAEIRSWCAATLGPVWGGRAREVLFRGYFACLAAPQPRWDS